MGLLQFVDTCIHYSMSNHNDWQIFWIIFQRISANHDLSTLLTLEETGKPGRPPTDLKSLATFSHTQSLSQTRTMDSGERQLAFKSQFYNYMYLGGSL